MPKSAEQVNTQRTLTKKAGGPDSTSRTAAALKKERCAGEPPCQMRVKSGKYVPALALLKGD